MRPLVFILILANLVLYALVGQGEHRSQDSQRLNQELNPERLSIVSLDTPPAATPQAPPAPETAATPHTTLCLRWSDLSPETAHELILLAEAQPDLHLDKQEDKETQVDWWVHIPPLGDKASADKKAKEIRRLGVTDYFILTDAGPQQYALSLGIFSNERTARERLADLKNKGIRSARVKPRPSSTTRITVTGRGPEPRMQAFQAQVAETLPGLRVLVCP